LGVKYKGGGGPPGRYVIQVSFGDHPGLSWGTAHTLFDIINYRQDKLILLLDSGTSIQVRRTAAKQLSDLTVKTFKGSIGAGPKREEDVVPEDDNKVVISAQPDLDEAWSEVIEVISKIIPLLRSKSSDTRHAASFALGLLASNLPPYPETSSAITSLPGPSSSPIDIATLLKSGQTLLASAGREYIAKPLTGDKAKRRKAMMGSLGLGDAVGWGDDIDNVIGEEDEAMEVDSGKKGNEPALTPEEQPKDVFEGLSARQIIMLKRKKGNIVDEANK
jgi:TATA-binding protein-associated factor